MKIKERSDESQKQRQGYGVGNNEFEEDGGKENICNGGIFITALYFWPKAGEEEKNNGQK